MKVLNILLVFHLFVIVEINGKKNSLKILNGTPVKQADLIPYQLQLECNGGRVICGAALISSEYALTAAHCTNACNGSQIYLIGGSIQRKIGTRFKVVKFIQHSSFSTTRIDYDISLLKFNPIQLRPELRPAKLPSYLASLESNQVCLVSGFGVTDNKKPSYVLLAANVSIVSISSCFDLYRRHSAFNITSRMICAKSKEAKGDACNGDSVRKILKYFESSKKNIFLRVDLLLATVFYMVLYLLVFHVEKLFFQLVTQKFPILEIG